MQVIVRQNGIRIVSDVLRQNKFLKGEKLMSYFKDKLVSVRVDGDLYRKTIETLNKKKRWKFDYSFSDLVCDAMTEYLNKQKKK